MEQLVEIMNGLNVRSIIDLGCGYGQNVKHFSTYMPKIDVLGVDICSEYIKIAKKTHPDCRYQVYDIRSWKPSKKYDAGFTKGVLIHVSHEDIDKTIRKIMSYVKYAFFLESSAGETKGHLKYDPKKYWDRRSNTTTEDRHTLDGIQYYFSHDYENICANLGFKCSVLLTYNPQDNTKLYLCQK